MHAMLPQGQVAIGHKLGKLKGTGKALEMERRGRWWKRVAKGIVTWSLDK